MHRVLLAVCMTMLRKALVAVLSVEEDIEVVADLDEGDLMLATALAANPNVAVVDIDLFGGNGVPRLCDELPGCAVLVLACPDRLGPLRPVLDARVRGLLGKDAGPRELADAIRRVARGERVVDPVVAAAMVTSFHNPLTERELEVLRIAAEGAPPLEIARRLFLSERTVRNYLSTIVRKTGSRTRLECVRKAEAGGWL